MSQLNKPQTAKLQAKRAGINLRNLIVIKKQLTNRELKAVECTVTQMADLVEGQV